MSLLSGAVTLRRYLVSGSVPDNFRSSFADALQARAFQAPAAVTLGQTYGWARADNLLETDFGAIDRWLFNQYAVFLLRIEQRKLPPRLFRAMLKQRVAAWCQEHKRERAPAVVRTEIKELLEDELAARTLPLVRTHEVVWNIHEGWVAIDSHAQGVGDMFTKLFRDTFGLGLVEAGPLEWLRDAPDTVERLQVTHATCFTDPTAAAAFAAVEDQGRGDDVADLAEGRPALDVADLGSLAAVPHLTTDFLLWLWWRSETQSGRLELGDELIDVWVDDRVATRRHDGGGRVARVGDDASRGSSSVGTLLDGHVVSELRIGLRRQGREYKATIKAGLLLAGCKLPTECKGADDEVLYERGYLLEDLWFALSLLYRRFAAERIAASWYTEAVPGLAAWAMHVHQGGVEPEPDDVQAVRSDDHDADASNADLPDGPIALYREGPGAPELVARAMVTRGRVQVTEYAVRAPAVVGPAAPTDPFRELLDLTEELIDHADRSQQIPAHEAATEATRWRDICRNDRTVPATVQTKMRRWRRDLDRWRGTAPA